MVSLVNEAYKIADSNNVILKGNIKISNNTNCLIFAHYCDSTNVDTHEIITARAIVNEESLLDLCEELGWKTDWYIVYKNLVL